MQQPSQSPVLTQSGEALNFRVDHFIACYAFNKFTRWRDIWGINLFYDCPTDINLVAAGHICFMNAALCYAHLQHAVAVHPAVHRAGRVLLLLTGPNLRTSLRNNERPRGRHDTAGLFCKLIHLTKLTLYYSPAPPQTQYQSSCNLGKLPFRLLLLCGCCSFPYHWHKTTAAATIRLLHVIVVVIIIIWSGEWVFYMV